MSPELTIHQFEIRLYPILGFSSEIKSKIAPFIKLFKRVQITNENTSHEQLHFLSDDNSFEIGIRQDNLYIRAEQELSELLKTNSAVNSLFFKFLDVMKELESFAGIKHYLHYTLQVVLLSMTEEEIVTKFQSEYVSNKALNVFDKVTDIGISIENTKENSGEKYSFGPYLGLGDLEKRKMVPKTESLLNGLIDGKGIICEFREDGIINSMDTKKYNEISKRVSVNLDKFWQKINEWK